MTTPQAGEAPAPPVAPTSNQNTGQMNNSVQAGVVETCNIFGATQKARLIARAASNDELQKARNFFVPPDNFPKAQDVLRNEHVVVLVGTGCGRRYAAIRLLAEQSYDQVLWLDPDRPMDTVSEGDIQAEHGYLWDLRGLGDTRPFGEQAFAHIRGLVAGISRCGLVIVLDGGDHVPSTAASAVVQLGPPDAAIIAEQVITSSKLAEAQDALTVLHDELPELVAAGISPERAQYAAKLALRVATGEIDVAKAKDEFHEGLDHELARVMAGSWSSMEYTMMCAVALLHDEPFEDVVAAQRELDDKVREAELTTGKPLRPRRTFFKPNDRLLHAINAVVEERDNPGHPGLRMRTVRFARSGWVEAVLPRIWQQYHVDHRLLLDWMCSEKMAAANFGASVRALTALIRHVPVRDRLDELDKLVNVGGVARWRLAAVTLSRLEKIDDLRVVAQDRLAQWVLGGSFPKCAAIVYYGYRFDAEPDDSIAQLAELARHKSVFVHNVSVGTLLGRMMWSDRRDLVLRAVVSWLDLPRPSREDGLHAVVLDLGRYLLQLTEELTEKLPFEPLTLISDYPDHCRRILQGILADPDYGPEAVRIMVRQTLSFSYFSEETKYQEDVLRLAGVLELLAPGLRWWSCVRLRAKLRAQFPQFASQINVVVRTARRVHRSGPPSAGNDPRPGAAVDS